MSKDSDDNVAKLRRQLKLEGKLGRELKRLGMLPKMDPALFRSPRLQDLERRPKSKLTEKPERARKQAAVREIARRRFADAGVPPQMSTAKFLREFVKEDWPLVAPRYGLDPKRLPDWHTVHKAIGRET